MLSSCQVVFLLNRHSSFAPIRISVNADPLNKQTGQQKLLNSINY